MFRNIRNTDVRKRYKTLSSTRLGNISSQCLFLTVILGRSVRRERKTLKCRKESTLHHIMAFPLEGKWYPLVRLRFMTCFQCCQRVKVKSVLTFLFFTREPSSDLCTMAHSPPWEAHLVKKSRHILWPACSLPCYQEPDNGPFFERDKSSHTLWLCSPRIHSDVVIPFTPLSSGWSQHQELHRNYFTHFSSSCACYMPVRLMLLDSVTLIILDLKYVLCSSSLCSFPQPPVS